MILDHIERQPYYRIKILIVELYSNQSSSNNILILNYDKQLCNFKRNNAISIKECR